MMNNSIRSILALAVLSAPVGAIADDRLEGNGPWQEVSGTAIHYFDSNLPEPVPGRNIITHRETPTETGVKLRTTETIDLFGDLEGRVLYHPETEINFAAGKLVNTGDQVFSGTVLGQGPVLVHDDMFRFEVDLQTGATTGKAFLTNPISGPRVVCMIDIVGTGFTEEGNGLAEYTGRCRIREARPNCAD